MLKNRQDLIALREGCMAAAQLQKRRILVCAGTGCVSSGSLKIFDRLKELIEANGISCPVELKVEPHEPGIHGGECACHAQAENADNSIAMKKSGCHGFCEMGPLVRIEPEGYLYTKVKLSDCEEIVEKTILNNEPIDRLAYKRNGEIYRKQEEIPFYKNQTRIVLEHCGHIDALSVKEYLSIGGYTAFEKALFDMTPDDIVNEISESKLRGRGGGGFPTGKKWAQVKAQKAEQKYVVCNGDEGDPGAFMDRAVLEGDPHTVLEAMAIGGYAIGAHTGVICIRAEYPLAVRRLEIAIRQAEELGLLGRNIFDSGFDFRIEIKYGAGAFVCGEETALIHSIEGKRGEPTVKPPFPAVEGLWKKPTVVNNVETYACIGAIVRKGAEWFRSLGTAGSPGTKVFALAGKVAKVGLVEVPMGTTLRDIVFGIGGGIKNGRAFKAVQTGGPSGGCITPANLDLPIDYEALKSIGSMMGSGGMIVMDEDDCMVNIAKFFLEFTLDESCGKCTPCRIGNRRMYEMLNEITEGRASLDVIDRLKTLSATIKDTALCGLGQTSPNPVLSTLANFEAEYLAHVKDSRCPAGVCAKLIRYEISDRCVGCGLCLHRCPVNCISGERKMRHRIDQSRCIKCGVCFQTCKFHAVEKH